MRALPYVGQPATIVHLGARHDAVVTSVAGPRITVRDSDSLEHSFELNELTGHWVRAGEPYYGVRLTLREDPA